MLADIVRMKGFVERMDRSKVIRASAGTGKTYRLSIEILVLLFSGVEVGEVFSITFTRKAAAEIRDRVI
jgi:ATP-dependent exoDNAse (exonuclease V) beta subunit